jgi:hypothetical protein
VVRPSHASRPGTRSDFYIVPRDPVVALAHCGNALFLDANPGRGGRPRTTSRVAIKVADVEPYRERWDLLEHDADAAPWMIPEWVWDAAREYPPPVPLPDRSAAG